MYNKGLALHKDENLKDALAQAIKNGWTYIYMVDPKDQVIRVRLEYKKKRQKKASILIDTYTSSWDITEEGRNLFRNFFTKSQVSEGILEWTCGTRVMELICVKDEESYPTWLHLMLFVLSKPENIHDTAEDFYLMTKRVLQQA